MQGQSAPLMGANSTHLCLAHLGLLVLHHAHLAKSPLADSPKEVEVIQIDGAIKVNDLSRSWVSRSVLLHLCQRHACSPLPCSKEHPCRRLNSVLISVRYCRSTGRATDGRGARCPGWVCWTRAIGR